MRYKITIEDTANGTIDRMETNFYILHATSDDEAMTRTVVVGDAGPLDVVKCLMAHDAARGRIFAQDKDVELAYTQREVFIREGGMLDMTELKRQLGVEP